VTFSSALKLEPSAGGERTSDRRTFLLALGASLAGCATVQEIAGLRDVAFSIAGASGATVAGVSIGSIRTFQQLGAAQLATLGTAAVRGALPVEADLLVRATNPAGNAQARLIGFDWTLFLDGRETVSGLVDRDFVLPPGEPATIPVHGRLDLLDFFDRQLEQVVNLALAVAGAREPQRVRLEATPSISTPIGPIRYPRPIPIEYDVGR
jgi:hypothetical protein